MASHNVALYTNFLLQNHVDVLGSNFEITTMSVVSRCTLETGLSGILYVDEILQYAANLV